MDLQENKITTEETVIYPPKYVKPPQQALNIWLKSFISLTLYLVLGYYVFKSFSILLAITAIVVIHELGHFLAMKYFKYKELGIFFIPLLGAYVSGTKREVSQKESAIILLAGPLPGILLGIGFYFLYQAYPFGHTIGVSYYQIAVLFLFLNILNLLPIYPLDGGQLLNRVFLNDNIWVSRIFIFLSVALMVWFAISQSFYPLLLFPAMLLLRFFDDARMSSLEKRMEQSGINMDVAYEDLPDEDYWKIRSIIVEEQAAFQDVPQGPPYEYHEKEEKIMTVVQSLLHRHLIQDLSIAEKILIFIICVAAIASPWLLQMDLLRYFGF